MKKNDLENFIDLYHHYTDRLAQIFRISAKAGFEKGIGEILEGKRVWVYSGIEFEDGEVNVEIKVEGWSDMPFASYPQEYLIMTDEEIIEDLYKKKKDFDERVARASKALGNKINEKIELEQFKYLKEKYGDRANF